MKQKNISLHYLIRLFLIFDNQIIKINDLKENINTKINIYALEELNKLTTSEKQHFLIDKYIRKSLKNSSN